MRGGQGEVGTRVDIGPFGHDRSRRVAEFGDAKNTLFLLSFCYFARRRLGERAERGEKGKIYRSGVGKGLHTILPTGEGARGSTSPPGSR